MEIVFSKFKKHEQMPAFRHFKTYMKPVIDAALGWDEHFQRSSYQSRLKPEWFDWVICNGNKVGFVCWRPKPGSLHIHLLIIFAHEQRKGFASSVVQKLRSDAFSKGLDLTLSCFKTNEPALNMYRKLGFVVSSEDELFYEFVRRSEQSN